MAVQKTDYGQGGMWGVLAADRAAQGNKELARMQLGLEREKMQQQGRLAQQQVGLQRQQLDFQRAGLRQRGQLSREQMKQQEVMQGQQFAQQTMLAKLTAEEREKDRQLQSTLANSKQEFMKGERRAAQEFQAAMASKQFERGIKMWERQKKYQKSQAELQMANQYALMAAQMKFARSNQKAKQEMMLSLNKQRDEIGKAQKVRDDLVERYQTALKVGDEPGKLGGVVGDMAWLLNGAGIGGPGAEGSGAAQLTSKYSAVQISSAIDALEKQARVYSSSKDEAERAKAQTFILYANEFRDALRSSKSAYVPKPEMSYDIIEKAMQDLMAGSDQRYGELEKTLLALIRANVNPGSLSPRLASVIFGEGE